MTAIKRDGVWEVSIGTQVVTGRTLIKAVLKLNLGVTSKAMSY